MNDHVFIYDNYENAWMHCGEKSECAEGLQNYIDQLESGEYRILIIECSEEEIENLPVY